MLNDSPPTPAVERLLAGDTVAAHVKLCGDSLKTTLSQTGTREGNNYEVIASSAANPAVKLQANKHRYRATITFTQKDFEGNIFDLSMLDLKSLIIKYFKRNPNGASIIET